MDKERKKNSNYFGYFFNHEFYEIFAWMGISTICLTFLSFSGFITYQNHLALFIPSKSLLVPFFFFTSIQLYITWCKNGIHEKQVYPHDVKNMVIKMLKRFIMHLWWWGTQHCGNRSITGIDPHHHSPKDKARPSPAVDDVVQKLQAWQTQGSGGDE